MDDQSPPDAPAALLRSVERLLEPLVRLLLRHGLTYKAFNEAARRVFVRTAARDFALPRRKLSDSRIAVLTGLARRDIARLRAEGDGDPKIETSMNRAARVVAGWRRDSAFHDAAGRPASLTIDGESPTFTELVRRYAGDVPVAATFDELLRVAAITKTRDGRYRLAARAYVPSADDELILTLLGSHVRDLITTIDYNLTRKDAPARFQRRVTYDSIPVERLDALRDKIAQEAQALLERLDQMLSAEDNSEQENVEPQSQTARVGLGIFLIENENEDNDQ
ncbi:MAG: hypothetical protein ACI8TX_001866 [Hyphomicrobiaceae bacterium]|jgi:hypothetical protein